MTELLTAAQMRALEGAAIASGRVSGIELMERAGQGVVAAMRARWPELFARDGGRGGGGGRGRRGGGGRACVLCGPGANGGDGFVIARWLDSLGWRRIDVVVLGGVVRGDPNEAPTDARANFARLAHCSAVRISRPASVDAAGAAAAGAAVVEAAIAEADVVVDALFGTGLSRPLDAATRRLLASVDAARAAGGARVVAVDAPSGLCLDSGAILGAVMGANLSANLGGGAPDEREDSGDSGAPPIYALRCDLTVTFHRPKRGHYLAAGPDLCGGVVVCDIGLEGMGGLEETGGAEETGAAAVLAPDPPPDPPARLAAPQPLWIDGASGVRRWTDPALNDRLAALDKHTPGRAPHKYDFGHALVVSGPRARTGAARLAARAALRIGAGLVTVACPADAVAENAAHLTAIMLREAEDAAALAALLADARIGAALIGPGCGVGARTREMVAACLSSPAAPAAGAAGAAKATTPPPRAVVLDADALTSFADAPEALFALTRSRDPSDGVAMTPHGGEFARLFPDLADRLSAPPTRGPAYSRVDAARAAAERAGCVVVLKGPDTVIATPLGGARVVAAVGARRAPWLATAGSGDALAGLLVGLAARGAARRAACARGAASFGRGAAADLDADAETAVYLHQELGRLLGPGLIADDLPDAIPALLTRILDGEAAAAS